MKTPCSTFEVNSYIPRQGYPLVAGVLMPRKGDDCSIFTGVAVELHLCIDHEKACTCSLCHTFLHLHHSKLYKNCGPHTTEESVCGVLCRYLLCDHFILPSSSFSGTIPSMESTENLFDSTSLSITAAAAQPTRLTPPIFGDANSTDESSSPTSAADAATTGPSERAEAADIFCRRFLREEPYTLSFGFLMLLCSCWTLNAVAAGSSTVAVASKRDASFIMVRALKESETKGERKGKKKERGRSDARSRSKKSDFK